MPSSRPRPTRLLLFLLLLLLSQVTIRQSHPTDSPRLAISMGKVAVAAAKAAPPPPSPGKPTTLLDVHEVEWITRELERLLVRETVGAGARADARRRRKRAEAKAASGREAHAKKGGFLAELLGKHAASICGDGAVSGAGRSGFREVDKV